MDKTCVSAAGLYCGLGMMVPVAPTVIAIGAAVVVRILLWSKKQSFMWNMCVMLLAALATFATMEGDSSSPFSGFWIGVGYGGAGQGIINMGRNAMMSTLKERMTKAVDAFLGTKTPPSEE